MNYLELGLIILIVSIILCICGTYVWYKNKDKRNLKGFIGATVAILFICLLGVEAITTGIYVTITYSDAISLPYEYTAACDTINETSQLLMRYDNIPNGSFNSIGYGLESQELKLTLKDAIQTKNNLRAEILTWLHNPMTIYKDILIQNLPADFQ